MFVIKLSTQSHKDTAIKLPPLKSHNHTQFTNLLDKQISTLFKYNCNDANSLDTTGSSIQYKFRK